MTLPEALTATLTDGAGAPLRVAVKVTVVASSGVRETCAGDAVSAYVTVQAAASRIRAEATCSPGNSSVTGVSAG